MLEIGKLLMNNAYDSRIEQEDDEFKPAGGKEANICMYIYPNGEGADSGRAKDYPCISFTASWHGQTILIHGDSRIPGRSVSSIATRRGSSGLRGACPIEQITGAFVYEEIVKLMKEAFKR